MNKQKFIEYLHKPGHLTEDSLKELDELISEFPYFQTARVLAAKGNKIKKTSKTAGRTASAAIYSTNRLLLKKYLTGDIFLLQPVVGNESVGQGKGDPRPIQSTRLIEPPNQSPVAADTPTSPVDIPGESVTTRSNIDQIISDLQNDMKELEASRARYLEVTRKIEEEDAVEEALKKATFQKEKQKEAADDPTPSTSVKTTAKKTTSAKKKPATSTTKGKPAGSAKTTAKKTTTRKATKATSPQKTAASTRKTTAKKTTTKSTSKKGSATKPNTSAKKSTAKSNQAEKKKEPDLNDQRELIDAFIKVNPSFSPNHDKTNEADYSLESSKLHDDFVSEYLAEIFLEQGKNDRAIEIYNSLMLRFPEKRAYFAGLIKKIK